MDDACNLADTSQANAGDVLAEIEAQRSKIKNIESEYADMKSDMTVNYAENASGIAEFASILAELEVRLAE